MADYLRGPKQRTDDELRKPPREKIPQPITPKLPKNAPKPHPSDRRQASVQPDQEVVQSPVADQEVVQSPVADQEVVQSPVADQGIIQQEGQLAETGIYQPQAYEASQDELVSAQVSRLLGENSSYLQMARAQAQQAAHARGLSNTAMAAGWGQSAAIQSALPIAQQDAGYFQNRGLEDQKGIISSHLQKQKWDIDKDLLVTDIASQEKQQQVGIAANKALQAQQDAAYMERLQVEISARSDLQSAQNAAESYRQKVEIAAQQKLAELEFDRETQVQLTDSMGTLSQQFQRETAEILTNPDFKTAADRNKALQSSAKAYQDSVNLMASLAGVEVTWPTNFTTNTQTTSSTGTTTGTGTTTTGTGTTTTQAPTMTEAQITQLNRSRTLTKDSVPPAGYKLVYHRSGLNKYYTFEKA